MKILIDFKSCKLVLTKISGNYLAYICDLTEILTGCATAWIWPFFWYYCRYDEWDLLCAEGSHETKASKRHMFTWSTQYRHNKLRTTVHETVFVLQQLNYNNYTKQNFWSKFLKTVSGNETVSKSLWNDLYVLFMVFYMWELWCISRERHFYSTLVVHFLIHCFSPLLQITDYCFHINSVHYIKRNLSAVRKKKSLTTQVGYTDHSVIIF